MPQPCRGYALLEVLIALALLAGAATATLHRLAEGVATAHEVALQTRAVLAAEEVAGRAQLVHRVLGSAELAELATDGWRTATCADDAPVGADSGLDLDAWLAEWGCAAPVAEARVEVLGEQFTVELRWRRDGAAESATWSLERAL